MIDLLADVEWKHRDAKNALIFSLFVDRPICSPEHHKVSLQAMRRTGDLGHLTVECPPFRHLPSTGAPSDVHGISEEKTCACSGSKS